jgi:dynein axonemal heavy chain
MAFHTPDDDKIDSPATTLSMTISSPKTDEFSTSNAAHSPEDLGGLILEEDVQELDPELLQWFRTRIALPGYTPYSWKAEHCLALNDFIYSKRVSKLIVFMDPDSGLCVNTVNSAPPHTVKTLQYFLKTDENATITMDNVVDLVQYGTMRGSPVESLLQVMNSVFLPSLLANTKWPESVRKEFTGQLHKFMASLIDSANHSKGHTVLYVPDEDIADPETASKDKDLVQRLESTVIHWTRQIKEVVSNQETSQHADNCGPLEEIRFWRSRTVDLSGIREQLDRDGVRKIVQVLEFANSTYLKPFMVPANMIQHGSIEAQDNLKFLSTLQEPCEALAAAEPAQIPALLPDILNRIRMIWTVSTYYHSHERLTGLLRKVSNQIISQCSQKIDLNEIFNGDVSAAMTALCQSIQCGEAWQSIHSKTVSVIEMYSQDDRKWDFDSSSIFAQVDAFMQRCRDLLEVCEGQLQFARRTLSSSPGQSAPLPTFGGTRGAEIEKSLYEIQEAFEKHVARLSELDYNILDVKATRWHDDYNIFKSGMRDLEVMMSNIIASAWGGISTVEAGVDLLQSFYQLAKRSAMQQSVERRTVQLYAMLNDEIRTVRADFDRHRRNPPLLPDQPKHAGAAGWALGLVHRVQRQMKQLQQASYLPQTREAEEALFNYSQLESSIDIYCRQHHTDWTEEVKDMMAGTTLESRLDRPLMVRSSDSATPMSAEDVREANAARLRSQKLLAKQSDGRLETNFDKDLLRMFCEVRGWQQLGSDFPVPYAALDMSHKEEPLRIVRECVSLVVREYNTIIDALTTSERRLFHEHLRQIDQKLGPGLSKLTWGHKHIKNYFVRACLGKCREVYDIAQRFKANDARIKQLLQHISGSSLVDIEKNIVYNEAVFEQRQLRHQSQMKDKLQESNNTLVQTVTASYQFFHDHPSAVQYQWHKYVRAVDKKLDDALRSAVRHSLLDLSRAINGDAKSGGPHPLFKMNLTLDEVKGHIEFRPSADELSNMVKQVSRQAITCIKIIPRLVDALGDAAGRYVPGAENQVQNLNQQQHLQQSHQVVVVSHHDGTAQNADGSATDDTDSKKAPEIERPKLPTFYEIISNDSDILKVYVNISHGTSNIAGDLGKIVTHFDRYQPIWNMDKVAFIRRYAGTKRELSTFDMDITRYKIHQQDIQSEDPTHNVKFVRIDCTSLKQSLVSHCQQWQLKLTSLLHKLSSAELAEIREIFSGYTAKLTRKPTSIDELGESLTLAQRMRDQLPSIQARFDPLDDRYKCLDKFDVHVSDDEKAQLNGLPDEFEAFSATIDTVDQMLIETKLEMRRGLEDSLSSLNQNVNDIRSDFVETAPFSIASNEISAEDVETAIAFITEYRQRLGDLHTRESQLKNGLIIFNIDMPDLKEVDVTERELSLLERVWRLTESWLSNWSQWKVCRFVTIDPSHLDKEAQTFAKELASFSRSVKQWKCWQALSDQIRRFRQTMPLINDLRNPAMRSRHWEQLKDEIQQEFDHSAADFTLERVFTVGLHMHSEAIAHLSSIANREMAIENSLAEIAQYWTELELQLLTHKNRYWKLKFDEEVQDNLENHQLTLSTMKNSPYYVTFASDINKWVRRLNDVTETIDTVTQVQRQWIYLESIFMDSQDIRKQLPAESTMFDSVNAAWIQITETMSGTNGFLDSLLEDGLLDRFTAMNDKLDRIQHQLDQYLEKKRQRFPRFYFLSNDDLLEILGHSKDPLLIQKHVHKCFMGIKTLLLLNPEETGHRHYEVVGMKSDDGEEVKFSNTIVVAGAVESWMTDVEACMQNTLRKQLQAALAFVQKSSSKKEQWIKNTVGQLVITSGQIGWTAACTRALSEMRKNSRALRQLKSKWHDYLTRLTQFVRGDLTRVERKKLVALITIEVHARDVIDLLKSQAQGGVTSFEWISQLRFYYDRDSGDYGECIVQQTSTSFRYGYEYLGNCGRLVITPLTDRCYMTLTTALNLCRGGSPQGPAGTGKTETVKDLGKALSKFVVVFNCSDKLGVESLARNFSGLAQTGAWGCFDEFNRIKIEVLSVVALQISSILNAVKERAPFFNFEGSSIRLDPTVGIFITMNPGYAGRTALPDNLKSLFRPVAMMVPDSQLIAEIMLLSEGFKEAKLLSKKIVTIYNLMTQQLSKQDHYDYGLRAIKSVLTRAGSLRRSHEELSEDVILMRALQDMNFAKLVADDVPLFTHLMNDLFPSIELVPSDYGELQIEIQNQLRKEGLQVHQGIIDKILQLYETQKTRHGNMLVGRTLGGKSTVWRTLQNSLSALAARNVPGYERVETFVLNPKSVETDELYGNYDDTTQEWTDGIMSSLLRRAVDSTTSSNKWVIMDGPVDTLWIESMNSVLDDNKVLTLVNGDRIALNEKVSLLFEVKDLSVASPATVSRCGMVYVDSLLLGWRPYVRSWLTTRSGRAGASGVGAAAAIGDEKGTAIGGSGPSVEDNKGVTAMLDPESELLLRLFDKYAAPMLELKRHECKEPVPVDDFSAIRSLCRMYDAVATRENGLALDADGGMSAACARMAEMYFVFCAIWSCGGSVDEAGRAKMDQFVRDIEAQFPPLHTVYEYYVDPVKHEWINWSEKVNKAWRPAPGAKFYQILVPTIDTVRYSFIASSLMNSKQPLLFTGSTGTGKTSILNSVLGKLDAVQDLSFTINFSSATTSLSTQELMESRLEKRQRNNFGPAGARKRLVVFVDDLNMPQKDEYGSQPPIELLKHWLDYGFWYDRSKQTRKNITDTQLVAAMGPPGGSRSVLSERFQSRFNVVNLTFPADSQIRRIYGTLVHNKFQAFDEDIKLVAETMTQATLELYKQVSTDFLPTPSCSHYLFNMRDISKVFEGVMRCTPNFYDTRERVISLWVHECMRVFHDRLIDVSDRSRFIDVLNSKLQSLFELSWKKLFNGKGPDEYQPMFTDFFEEDGELAIASDSKSSGGVGSSGGNSAPIAAYIETPDYTQVRAFLEEKLQSMNMDPDYESMDLVMFQKAVQHVTRVHRIISQPRGSALLVGMGGSGRTSVTRLAAFIAGYSIFTVNPKKGYRQCDFYDDLKTLYRRTGVDCQPTVFLFSDTQLVRESFLEDINNILSSGEVPGLFPAEELAPILEELRPDASREGRSTTSDGLFAYFIERVRSNLHMIMCMSPVGSQFRDRLRMYPALVNCTTIDWFDDWPEDALLEVATKFLSSVEEISDVKQSDALARVFGTVHSTAVQASERMKNELRRYNYITPTKYLDLVSSYRSLLVEKQRSINDVADKLRNGLEKLDSSKEHVTEMSKELESKKKIVAQKKVDCEKLLIEIAQKQRAADEQRKQVELDAQRTELESKECECIKQEAEEELSKVMPALKAAISALDKLSKSAVTEIKSYSKPPALVEKVMSAVMIVLTKEATWASAKKELGDPNFLNRLKNFDKDNMSNTTLKLIGRYTKQKDFDPAKIANVSIAASAMCEWVIAMEMYGRVYRDVEPRRQALMAAEQSLRTKQQELEEAEAQLKEVTEKVAALQHQYETSINEKNLLAQEATNLETKLNRAAKLVDGLSGERERWEASIVSYDAALVNLIGDCALAAAFLSYAGAFPSEYRARLVQEAWMPAVKKNLLPHSTDFDFATFLADPTKVRDWNIQGLPQDSFSIENGVIVTRARRHSLMIDPQGQANQWIRAMESEMLKVLDPNSDGLLRELESAIQFGTPVLLQDVSEELDSGLDPVLRILRGADNAPATVMLGDKELTYNPSFRLYMTTKMNNPHFAPDVSIKTSVVNFAVKEQGLEEQLLALIVRMEQPSLEEDKDKLVLAVAQGKNRLAELEDEILSLLKNAGPNLLDDEVLIEALQTSKSTAETVKTQLRISEETEKKIDAARNAYRASAVRASILYFVLNDLARIDPMYQFSLEAYVKLFKQSIAESRPSSTGAVGAFASRMPNRAGGAHADHKHGAGLGGSSQSRHKIADRVSKLNDFHTEAVYNYTCRALFERHKLLFAFQLCTRIMASMGKLDTEEYDFFLRGGTVLDRSVRPANPCSEWLSEYAWDQITELDKLPHFQGILLSFEQSGEEWRTWYASENPPPELQKPVGEWSNKWNQFQRMVLLRVLRPDRLMFAARAFIAENLGQQFVDPPAFDLRKVFDLSSPDLPAIFVLSPGVDPSPSLSQLAADVGQRVEQVALGQGQTPIAEQLLASAVRNGTWLLLANCHLSIGWMPKLEKLIHMYGRYFKIQQGDDVPGVSEHELQEAKKDTNFVHPNFRLWLSSSPDSRFPITLLQSAIKMTTEPPRGIKANMLRLYNNMNEEQFQRSGKPHKYKKLLFALCFFHSVLIERRKFGSLGWNVPYAFNDSDFSVCDNLLTLYLDEYEETPWDALKYLIAEANYGGRVTNAIDRRILNVYMNQFFNDDAISSVDFPLAPEMADNVYYIPNDGNLNSYITYLSNLPASGEEPPEAFGQHRNADVSSQLATSSILLDTILSLQPRKTESSGPSREDFVLSLIESLLEQVPEPFDIEAVQSEHKDDPSPLTVVLIQEITRYNRLLKIIRRSLHDLSKGIRGLVVISPELEDVLESLFTNKVPQLWKFAYPSTKPLGSWTRDLALRIQQLSEWSANGAPSVFWLGGFTFPTGFLTALLQTTARRTGMAIDRLGWEFSILPVSQDAKTISDPPKDGAYIRGVYLEGARWNGDSHCLDDPFSMQLNCEMPIIHFKPVEMRRKPPKGTYRCPMYMYPIRTGTRERPSYVISVDLKAGHKSSEFWIKRGTALLLSLGD